MRKIAGILLAVLLPCAAIAQNAPATLPYHTVYGRIGATPGDTGPGQAIPFTTLGLNLLNSATLDADFCSTTGALLIRQTNPTAGWQCSTAGGTNGVGFGVSALNTNQFNASVNNQGLVSPASIPTVSPLDWRWTYAGAAPTAGEIIGPTFYVTASPSNSIDDHGASYNGLAATVYSNSATILANMSGGTFTAIRQGNAGGGSTNPIYGVVGQAFMGVTGDSTSAVGDGVFGGMFSAFPQAYPSGNFFDPISPGGVVGSISRAQGLVSGASTSNRQIIGSASYVGAEANILLAEAGYFSMDSRTLTMAQVENAIGIDVENISGSGNVAAAIRTKAGTVIFGGNETLIGKHLGNVTVTVPTRPTINKVKGGATSDECETPICGYQTGGTRTYTYVVVAKLANGGTSVASAAVSNSGGFLGYDDLSQPSQNNYLNWTPVEGAVSYDIYRTAAPGSVTNTTGKIANVPYDTTAGAYSGFPLSVTPPAYVDAGATGDSSSPPGATPATLQVDGCPTADSGSCNGAGGGTITAGSIRAGTAAAAIGYATGTGAGNTVTQTTNRTTAVTLNNITGAITLFSAAGSATAATFTVNNTTVAAGDVIIINQKSGTNLYETFVTAVAANSFNVTFFTTGGTATDSPVFNFAVIKGSAN